MTKAHARLIAYLLAVAAGAVVTVLGAIRGDIELIATGFGLLGVGGLASANTPVQAKHAAE